MTYLEEIADSIRRRLNAQDLPEGDDVTDLFVDYAVLLLAKGTRVTSADVHNAWAAWMLRHDPSHVSIVPFEDLSAEIRAEDSPFVAAIHAEARERT